MKSPLLITNVNIIPMPGSKVINRRDVLIEGSKIVQISNSRNPQSTAKTIDGTNKYLIPGLFDMHVHLHSPSFFPLFLMNGITAIRETGYSERNNGSIFDLRKRVAEGRILGPRLFICGPIIEGDPPMWAGFKVAKTAAQARKVVQNLKRRRVDFIKVYHTLKPIIYKAVLNEAKKQGLKVTGHIPTNVTPVDALKLGQVGLEHMLGITSYVGKIDMRDAAEKDYSGWKVFTKFRIQRKELNKLNASLDTVPSFVCPTLILDKKFSELANYGKLKASKEARYMPRNYRNIYWNPTHPKTSVNIRGLKPLFFKNYKVINEGAKKLPATLAKHTHILAGSDTPNPFVIPGFSLLQELELLVESGLKPHQALEAATYNGALFLDVLDELGTVEVGKTANLVLLDKNPLVNIKNIHSIRGVFVEGLYLPAAKLRKKVKTYS